MFKASMLMKHLDGENQLHSPQLEYRENGVRFTPSHHSYSIIHFPSRSQAVCAHDGSCNQGNVLLYNKGDADTTSCVRRISARESKKASVDSAP